MVPVGIPASTLEEPSRGSKTATYFSPSSMTISWESLVAGPTKSTGTSSSSEAKTPRRPVKRRARFKRSLVITSSFFWSSPWTLTSPWYPKVSLEGSWDRLTKLVMALQAVSIAPKRVVNSRSSGLSMATSFMKRVKVTPVVSQTSSKTGTLVWARDMVGVSTVEAWRELTPRLPAGWALNALAEDAARKIAQRENFIFKSNTFERLQRVIAFCFYVV
mmetsp:Transcript_13272/g.37358  ORF Transcript_13272/g.37358 Transcript_13272/m.37358 type:complete len:218 (-) Transcript_13272:116-769(-)